VCWAWRTPGRLRYRWRRRLPIPGWRPPTGLFESVGQATTEPTPFRQRTADFVEYLHSASSLAREWMTPEEAAAFDRAATEIIAPHAVAGWLDLTVVAEVSWGTVRTG
jgi:hypothetical protein